MNVSPLSSIPSLSDHETVPVYSLFAVIDSTGVAPSCGGVTPRTSEMVIHAGVSSVARAVDTGARRVITSAANKRVVVRLLIANPELDQMNLG